MIVKVYGEFWSRNRVNWTARELLGTSAESMPSTRTLESFYVGQPDSRGIGVRLCEHRTDRFAER